VKIGGRLFRTKLAKLTIVKVGAAGSVHMERTNQEAKMSKPIPANVFHTALPPIGHNAVDQAARPETTTIRNFDLPTRLFAGTVGLYFAFLGVMAFAFADPRLIVPMGIFYIYIIMAFGVPALWVRMKPDHADRPLSWRSFMREGVDTHTGRLAGRDATVQVLLLPTLILGWGVAMATIVALIG
jgi:hypothetical protein